MYGDVDILREALQVLVEGIMDVEVSAPIGAQRGERNPDRLTHRNGYRNRTWDTRVGTADTSLGMTPVLLMVSSIMPTACCLSEDWLVARAATMTWWAWSTTA